MSTAAHADAHARPETRILLACGILSSVAYVLANVVAGLSWPGYSFRSQTISELSAIGAPSRGVWVPLGTAYDLLLIAFGVGVWWSAGDRRTLRASAALLIAIGVLGPLWPPMHLRGATTTLTDTLHVVFAAVVSLLIIAAIVLGSGAAGRWFRAYSFATIAAMVVFGALSFHYGPALAANQPTPWLGVVERLDLAAYLAWIVTLSVTLLRRERA